MKKVNIAVCCGGGIFTTTVVTEKMEEFLKSERIPFSINPHKITEIAGMTGYDIIVVTGKTDQKNRAGAPVLIGLPMFTGIGEDEFKEELLEIIKDVQE